eukprot:767621-Pelagomonas_calceolata.AAC.3
MKSAAEPEYSYPEACGQHAVGDDSHVKGDEADGVHAQEQEPGNWLEIHKDLRDVLHAWRSTHQLSCHHKVADELQAKLRLNLLWGQKGQTVSWQDTGMMPVNRSRGDLMHALPSRCKGPHQHRADVKEKEHGPNGQRATPVADEPCPKGFRLKQRLGRLLSVLH